MTERAGPEVKILTICIPVRLQRRGGRKLIVTPEGAMAPPRKPARDETLIRSLWCLGNHVCNWGMQKNPPPLGADHHVDSAERRSRRVKS